MGNAFLKTTSVYRSSGPLACKALQNAVLRPSKKLAGYALYRKPEQKKGRKDLPLLGHAFMALFTKKTTKGSRANRPKNLRGCFNYYFPLLLLSDEGPSWPSLKTALAKALWRVNLF
jgi:hypothetical protein